LKREKLEISDFESGYKGLGVMEKRREYRDGEEKGKGEPMEIEYLDCPLIQRV
jgi:hypothetical protein